jgi:hypothetical protein
LQQTFVNFPREGSILALRRVADTVFAAPAHFTDHAVEIFADLLHEPAMMQSVEQPEAHALAEPGPLHHVTEPQVLSGMMKRPEDLRGVNERLDDVEVVLVGHLEFYIAQHRANRDARIWPPGRQVTFLTGKQPGISEDRGEVPAGSDTHLLQI